MLNDERKRKTFNPRIAMCRRHNNTIDMMSGYALKRKKLITSTRIMESGCCGVILTSCL